VKFAYLAAAATAVGIASAAASAAPVSYTLVPELSSITITGTVLGSPLLPQNGASTTTTYSGSIQADRTGSQLTLTGGSTIDAALQPLPQQPSENGTAGSAPADYGFTVSLGFLGTVLAAARDVALDATTAGPLTVGAGGALSGSAIDFSFVGGEVDFNGAGTVGERSLVGETGPNDAAAPATLTSAGLVETLTIPVSATFTTSFVSSDDTTLSVTGTLVATRTVVPEPATLSVAAAGVGLLAAHRRRRR